MNVTDYAHLSPIGRLKDTRILLFVLIGMAGVIVSISFLISLITENCPVLMLQMTSTQNQSG